MVCLCRVATSDCLPAVALESYHDSLEEWRRRSTGSSSQGRGGIHNPPSSRRTSESPNPRCSSAPIQTTLLQGPEMPSLYPREGIQPMGPGPSKLPRERLQHGSSAALVLLRSTSCSSDGEGGKMTRDTARAITESWSQGSLTAGESRP